jgi:hypothetical protein
MTRNRAPRKFVDVPMVEDAAHAVLGSDPLEPLAPAAAAARDLRAVRDRLVDLDASRVLLLAERDRLVVVVREAGAPWPVVEALAGVSRTALVKRRPVAQAAAPWWFA